MVSKNFLITGAARGIGRGLSRLLLQKGHRVMLVDNNITELNHINNLLSQQYQPDRDFQSIQCNLRSPIEIKGTAEAARQFFSGHVDCLINNAANTSGVGGSHFSELTLEDWNASVETNLTAPMLLSQACLSILQKTGARTSGGCIIHMSSTRAFMSEVNNEPYSATKAGLLGLTQSMATSLAPLNIRVNAILPGWIHVQSECKEADEEGQAWEEGLSKNDHEWHLNGRVGRVEDVLRAVEYLVESEFVTGAETVVDGGVTRKMVCPED
ncbi:hypothetical protein M409DRAFT_23941 [Zasmidium cellare ATCC 36951]|uniref:NAD(P)-binding protein n=1 Tax=Zasmidium cellare ATCC 36951 TaxID=1080233 RepID=A0A6A6CF15_ZASCE|nr:uncharacterized protein M409DRAFT_23941 [Zasmidium cellare ATCC 36951]KAF2165651.1 hypothetical protein M409DRAFT_23941 [Zasmidium cellare ATCC 36951]